MFLARLLALLWLATLPAFCQNFSLSPAQLVEKAEASYQAKDFATSVLFYRRALPVLDESARPGTEYNLACSQALAGDQTGALHTLEQAIDDGYTERKDTEADKDLVSLHTDPRWQLLLDRMRTDNRQQDLRWGDAAFATPWSPTLSDADKLAGLSELWAQAKFGFANFWHVPQLNWDQTYRDYIPQVLATHSTTEYYLVLQRFYAQLGDGHTGVYPPDLIDGKVDRLPLRTRLIDGHLIVIGTRNPAADLQGLQPGDEVVTINGEPAVTWAERTAGPFVSASSPQDHNERVYEYVPFLAPIGTTFTLGTQSPSGQQAQHRFTVAATPSAHVPLFSLRMLPGNIAYVALNGFDDDTAAKEWDKHWPEIARASSLILDLRENGGGSSSVGNHIMATLLDKPTPGELSRSTRWIATYRAWGKAQTPFRLPLDNLRPDAAHHFSGPAVLLTSPRTYSAGEDMAVVFSQAHRGKIIGEPTGGSTGQPLTFKLPGGGAARVCTKHDSFADGREFIGIGIQPDILIHLSRSDIVARRDTVLEAAVHALQQIR